MNSENQTIIFRIFLPQSPSKSDPLQTYTLSLDWLKTMTMQARLSGRLLEGVAQKMAGR